MNALGFCELACPPGVRGRCAAACLTVLALLAVATVTGSRPLQAQATPQGVLPAPKSVVTRINPIDRAEMVWVPPGSFQMGSTEGAANEKTVHRVRITDGYWMYRTEVTNAMYLRFRQQRRRPPTYFMRSGPLSRPRAPVVGATYQDAVAYASWAGGDLPTEAQWEYAARGPSGRPFPWGTAEPDDSLTAQGVGWPGRSTRDVGTTPLGASWCGVLDMVGNAWEWCRDYYDENFYSSSAASDDDPENTWKSRERVTRGASWMNEAFFQRASIRRGEQETHFSHDLGFRVMLPGPPPTSSEILHPRALTNYQRPSLPNSPRMAVIQQQQAAAARLPGGRVPAVPPGQPIPGELFSPLPRRSRFSFRVNPVDGSTMVRVSEGTFTMGADGGAAGEGPAHRVQIIPGYWIYQTEVTNESYLRFCRATGHRLPRVEDAERFGQPRQPVTGVDWADAQAYARWAKAMLPSEALWEFAARGKDGRMYPWGNEPPSQGKANYGKSSAAGRPLPPEDGWRGTAPSGAVDMAGNVLEWCRDGFNLDFYSTPLAVLANPESFLTTPLRPCRGGDWSSSAADLRVTRRVGLDPKTLSPRVGFRCMVPE